MKKYKWLLPAMWTATIFYFSLRPQVDSNKLLDFEGIDKLFHFLCYMILYLLWAWYISLVELYKKNDKKLLITLFMLGVLIEFMQYWMPFRRSFELWDMVANGAGVVAGYLFFQLLPLKVKNKFKKKE
jgi:VanZ family protein